MRRRSFLRAVGVAATAGLAVQTVDARPVPQPDPPTDQRPLSATNPRIWPAVARSQPLPLGAVDAFKAPARAQEMGVQWQRIMFDWSALQPHSSNDWDFAPSMLELARTERSAGRPMIGALMSSPSWASGTSDPKSPPTGLDAPVDDPRNVWAVWVRGLATRFAGVIDTWVMWNEPDVWSDENHARQWTGTVQQYYQLLKTGYLAARQANPNASVLLAGLTYWWDAAYGREQYLERLLRVMAADPSAASNNWYFDAAVLQLYNNPRGLFDAPRIFGDLLRAHGVPQKPMWVNETNVVPWDDPVAPLTPEHFRATQDEQANYLVQAVAYALAGGVSRLAVYKMVDDAGLRKNVEQAFGMVRADPDFSVRPIFRAFQMLRQEFAPTTRAQLMDFGTSNRVYLEQASLVRRLTVQWNMTPQATPVVLPALGTSAQLMDRFGALQPIAVRGDGMLELTLAPATANTIPGYPDAYFIGGQPTIVVEPLPDTYVPFAPTYENMPPPGEA
jgi:hypothetical protein